MGRFVSTTTHAMGFSESEFRALMVDLSESSGRLRTSPSFSETSRRATSLFVPQSNSRTTRDLPSWLREIIRESPSTEVSFSSMGFVTSSSTSRGAAPSYPVSTVMTGRSTVGVICTGIR